MSFPITFEVLPMPPHLNNPTITSVQPIHETLKSTGEKVATVSVVIVCGGGVLGSFCPCVHSGVCDHNVKFLLLATRHQYVQHKQQAESALCTSRNRCHQPSTHSSHQPLSINLELQLLQAAQWRTLDYIQP